MATCITPWEKACPVLIPDDDFCSFPLFSVLSFDPCWCCCCCWDLASLDRSSFSMFTYSDRAWALWIIWSGDFTSGTWATSMTGLVLPALPGLFGYLGIGFCLEERGWEWGRVACWVGTGSFSLTYGRTLLPVLAVLQWPLFRSFYTCWGLLAFSSWRVDEYSSSVMIIGPRDSIKLAPLFSGCSSRFRISTLAPTLEFWTGSGIENSPSCSTDAAMFVRDLKSEIR